MLYSRYISYAVMTIMMILFILLLFKKNTYIKKNMDMFDVLKHLKNFWYDGNSKGFP